MKIFLKIEMNIPRNAVKNVKVIILSLNCFCNVSFVGLVLFNTTFSAM